MSYGKLLTLAAPETILVVTVLAVLAAEFGALRGLDRNFRRFIAGMIACVGCVGAIAWTFVSHSHGNAFDGMLVVDSTTQLVKAVILALTIFTIILSMDLDLTPHVGEYLSLILLATVGMMFMVSSEDVLMIFISLELTSLSLYILTAFNKRDIRSAEAALKYFLFGGMSAAFTLFGLSLLYGLSGSTNLPAIAAALEGRGLDPLLAVAIVMVVVGFGFKVAAVPFHLWAPDAYQGAPVPSAALIASGSKVASFFVFAKVMTIGFAGAEGSGALRAFVPGWMPVIAAVAAMSLLLGNLAAIVQTSVRRLLAYSAIAHGGYMLLAILSRTEGAMHALIYYASTYGLTVVGAFGVVAVVERGDRGDAMNSFAGLSRRAPLVSLCMLVFMLSLAGIPPLAGFFGKFYLFAETLKADESLLWLVILAIAMSAVSFYYYLQVLKRVYVMDSPESASMQVPALTQIVLCILAVAVLALGCFPGWFIALLSH